MSCCSLSPRSPAVLQIGDQVLQNRRGEHGRARADVGCPLDLLDVMVHTHEERHDERSVREYAALPLNDARLIHRPSRNTKRNATAPRKSKIERPTENGLLCEEETLLGV